jgi:hypothetical protein
VAALLVTGLVLILNFVSDTPTGGPSGSPASAGSSAASTASSAATNQQISSSPGIPSATATIPVENLQAGDGCGWQLEGDRRTSVDGVALVCTLADGTYQWRSPG